MDWSEALGVPAEAREALCRAVLGALARDGVRVALPRVTGGTYYKVLEVLS